MQDIRAEAEEHIYKKLISKMDEFIELASYDWTLRNNQLNSFVTVYFYETKCVKKIVKIIGYYILNDSF